MAQNPNPPQRPTPAGALRASASLRRVDERGIVIGPWSDRVIRANRLYWSSPRRLRRV